MTVQELINLLNTFPKDDYVGFYAWDEFDGENNLLNFNSMEEKDEKSYKMVGIYLE